MHQKKPKKVSPVVPVLSVGIVRGYTERPIADYVLAMLEFVDAPKGHFELHIARKIKARGGFHHGVKIKDLKYGKVRMTVQSSDNGTCYLCYLRSAEMKAHEILELLDSKLTLGHFDVSMLAHKKATAAPIGPNVGSEIAAAVAEASATEAPKAKVSLAGGADDPVVVAMILISIRLRHGMDGFGAKAFHELITREYAPGATTHAAGQFVRRIAANNYLTSEGPTGKKVYRLAEKGLRLLAEHDKTLAESAAGALQLTGVDELYPALAALEAKARKHVGAVHRQTELGAQIAEKSEHIDRVRRGLEEAVAEREALREQARAEQAVIDDPELASARRVYDDIQAKLKSPA